MQPDLVLFTGVPFALLYLYYIIYSLLCEVTLKCLFLTSPVCCPPFMAGDYGNENVQLVKSISDLQLPKAAILGNHDCWHTYQFSEK